MQDIFFTDSDEVPLPPAEVRIRQFEATPRKDGQRVVVRIALTPFQQRPNLELTIRNQAGEEVSSLSVVEAIDANMDFTMHLREKNTGGTYSLEMRVFYTDIEAHEGVDPEKADASEILDLASQVVDQRQIEFIIPSQSH